MITPNQWDQLATPILDLYHEFEITVMQDIARRLKNLDFASAAWQAQRLTESGALYQNVIKEVARLTGKSEKEIATVLSSAGVKSIKFDDAIYKEAGLKPLPLNLSPEMLQVLKAGLVKTNGVLNNLTLTTAITSQQSYIKASDMAYMQVSTGAMSYDQAIRAAIKNIAADGLQMVDYASGHRDNVDVAVRRTVLTGVAQTTHQLQLTRMDELGTDLVAVSAHAGARNKGTGPENHQSWQGKIYSRSGHKNSKYPDFVTVTGYGTGAGLGGWNCRHSFYPYFEGISENAYKKAELQDYARQKVKYQDKEISLYDATQIQRELERNIRKWKRQAMALDAAGLDATAEWAKVHQWQATMRSFINQTDLNRQYVREQVIA